MLPQRLLWVLPALLLAVGCGKKGPPLAPIVRIPAAIDQITAQRTGDEVFVTLTVPASNIDTSVPVDVARIEVYGYTGRTAPPRARWAEFGELVASIPVSPPPVDADAGGATAPPPASAAPGDALPGLSVTIKDTLSASDLVQGRVDPVIPSRAGQVIPTQAVREEPTALRRFYAAFGFSARGRPGPPGAATEFAIGDLPVPPERISAPYDATAVSLEWSPSDGIVGFLFEHPLGPEEVPLDDQLEPVVPAPSATQPDGVAAVPVLPAGPIRYNVYRELAPDPLEFPTSNVRPSWSAVRPVPLNAMPLEMLAFTDPVELNRPRCYVVRAIRGGIEGDASSPVCVTPVDIFPPVAPTRLVAVADQGGISLVWEPNSESDLGGYLVLRGDAADATLQPLTSQPVVEPRFRDTRVTSGTRYVYAVVAVDSHIPVSNVSAESNRVEETAR